MTVRIGSLFSGYGGLTLGVQAVVAWHSEVDQAPSRILDARFPGVPNLGDITTVDWSAVEPVDVIEGGSPCQDVSMAGRRAGMRAGTRSGLWASMCDAIDIIRPRLVVWENVRGVLSAPADCDLEPCPWCLGGAGDGEPLMRALGRVVSDLADIGYDAAWHGLRAADVGAPHGRFRVFVVAWPAADTDSIGPVRGWGTRGWWPRPADAGRGDAAYTDGAGREGPQPAPGRHLPDGRTPADATGDGRYEGRPEPAGLVGRPDAALGGAAPAADADSREPERRGEPGLVGGAPAEEPREGLQREWAGDAPRDRRATAADADRDGLARVGRVDTLERDPDGRSGSDTAWGVYEPAIRRWERTLGRPAPAPTELGAKGQPRLSPRFVEWLMGLPAGWVCDVPGLSRNDQMKALGNGVVPQQAAAAARTLLAATDGAAA